MHGEALTRRSLLRGAGMAAAALPAATAIPWSAEAGVSSGLAAPDPLVHLVSRITFGLSPRDLARARQLGFEGFVEEQLHPETIDDSEVEAAVRAGFPTVALGPVALEAYGRLIVAGELKAATVLRAVAGRRQLFEMMVDFWSNHFNVHHLDGPCAYYKTIEDRELIRRHAFGRFKDLLVGSAKSPAMIVYLDNFSNLKSSPNENYARELMELHTLGVDGGFTEEDVQEVARAFTGWTLRRMDGAFRRNQFSFNPLQHDDGARTVLGTPIPAGLGIGHGERVLDLLAEHPSCARFLATKLCRRFVADRPPAPLVDRAAATFTATGGDVREVMRVILLSSEFRAAAGQKLKRPLEVVASALRTLAARVSPAGAQTLLAVLKTMGQLPFDWPPPNGYPDVAEAWANTNGLLDRWNLGLALASGALPGVEVDLDSLADGLRGRLTPAALADHLAERLLGRPLDAEDHREVARFLAAGGPPNATLPPSRLRNAIAAGVALILSSPAFQWR